MGDRSGWTTSDTPLNRVNVHSDDIMYAQKQDRWACAIVRAIQRQLPDALFVRADKNVIAYSIDGHRYEHDTPDAAIKRVIRPLDQGEEIRPTSFNLGPATVHQTQKMTNEQKQHVRAVRRGEIARTGKGRKPKGTGLRSSDRFCEPIQEGAE